MADHNLAFAIGKVADAIAKLAAAHQANAEARIVAAKIKANSDQRAAGNTQQYQTV